MASDKSSTSIEIELLRRDLSDRFDRIERSVLDLAAEFAAFRGTTAALTQRTNEPPVPAVEEEVLTARDKALALLLDAGAAGIGATRLTEALAEEDYLIARQTVQNWLSHWAAEGRCVRRHREQDRYPTYVHFEHA